MVWAASTILTGAALGLGAYSSSRSAGRAADSQSQAADQANQTQRDQYNQTRQDNAPWRAAGAGALGQLSDGIQPGGQFTKRFGAADFQTDPGYAFRKQQGQDALDNSASARGGLLSGAQLKASADYNQNFASNEYSNAYNRFNTDRTNQYNQLAGIAKTGQIANELNAQSGANMANKVNDNQIGAGNARGSSYIAQSNALNNALGNGYNAFSRYSAMQQQNDPNNAAYWGGNMYSGMSGYGVGLPLMGYNAKANGGWGIE